MCAENVSDLNAKHGEVFFCQERSVFIHNKYVLSPNPSAMVRYTGLKTQTKLARSSEASYECPQSRLLPRTYSSQEEHDSGSTLSCSSCLCSCLCSCSVLCSCLRYKAYVLACVARLAQNNKASVMRTTPILQIKAIYRTTAHELCLLRLHMFSHTNNNRCAPG